MLVFQPSWSSIFVTFAGSKKKHVAVCLVGELAPKLLLWRRWALSADKSSLPRKNRELTALMQSCFFFFLLIMTSFNGHFLNKMSWLPRIRIKTILLNDYFGVPVLSLSLSLSLIAAFHSCKHSCFLAHFFFAFDQLTRPAQELKNIRPMIRSLQPDASCLLKDTRTGVPMWVVGTCLASSALIFSDLAGDLHLVL